MQVCKLVWQAKVNAYHQESVLWFEQQSEGGCQMVVLPWRLEVVCHCQIMHCPAHHHTSFSLPGNVLETSNKSDPVSQQLSSMPTSQLIGGVDIHRGTPAD